MVTPGDIDAFYDGESLAAIAIRRGVPIAQVEAALRAASVRR